MGTNKLKLSAVGCLGGKATEFNIRIAWARSRCHTLNIWGSWIFGCLILCLCHALCSSLALRGSDEGAPGLPDVAACCHVPPSFTARFLIQCPMRSGESLPLTSVVSEQALHDHHVPFARGWVLLCLALIWKIIAFLSYKEYSFKNRNFQVF